MRDMKHWLVKSEPDEFSIAMLKRRGREPWTGVRNYQARNFMKQMKLGDPVLFYHSSCAVPGVYGLAEVVAEAYPDPTQFRKKSHYFDPKSTPEEPRWWCVDVGYERTFAEPVTLERLRADAEWFGEFALLQRGNRLSVLPVSPAEYRRILSFEA